MHEIRLQCMHPLLNQCFFPYMTATNTVTSVQGCNRMTHRLKVSQLVHLRLEYQPADICLKNVNLLTSMTILGTRSVVTVLHCVPMHAYSYCVIHCCGFIKRILFLCMFVCRRTTLQWKAAIRLLSDD